LSFLFHRSRSGISNELEAVRDEDLEIAFVQCG
jgi:hypothetical protein